MIKGVTPGGRREDALDDDSFLNSGTGSIVGVATHVAIHPRRSESELMAREHELIASAEADRGRRSRKGGGSSDAAVSSPEAKMKRQELVRAMLGHVDQAKVGVPVAEDAEEASTAKVSTAQHIPAGPHREPHNLNQQQHAQADYENGLRLLSSSEVSVMSEAAAAGAGGGGRGFEGHFREDHQAQGGGGSRG